MRINEILLTKAEMNEAVSDWLVWHNLKVVVSKIETVGYPVKGWSITVDCDTSPKNVELTAPKPAIQNVEVLTQAVDTNTI